ncbi:HAD family hydrolase [Micromonospora sp. H33]|uniref:HAD family hydrolase n=1 Tax=Micromonospora sp. H33 TaxID=3452215 RepID=UPI003F8B5196
MSVREFAGVLWDLDGVLIDSSRAIVALWRRIAAGYGRWPDPAAIRRDVLGCAPEHTVAALFGDLPEDDRQDVLRQVREAEPALDFVAVPGAVALVGALRDARVPMALVTGASDRRARRVVRELGLAGAFTAMVTWGETPRGKPAPDCYRLGAERLGLDPARCLVVEDSSGGVRAATAAGAASVGVGEQAGLTAAGATWTAPAVAALRAAPGPEGVRLDIAGAAAVLLRAAPPAAPAAPAAPSTAAGVRR